MATEEGVGFAEVVVTEEATVGRERGGVRGLEDEVFILVDERGFAARIAAPEEKNEVGAGTVEIFNSGGGESFPAFAAVGAGSVRLHRKDGVEEEDALFLPTAERAGGVLVVADIGVDFFVDVDERGRDGLRSWNRKGETFGGAGSVVGILTQDDDFDFVEISSEGAEDELLGWVDGLGLVGFVEKGGEFLEVGLFELGFQKRFPAFVHSPIITQMWYNGGNKEVYGETVF